VDHVAEVRIIQDILGLVDAETTDMAGAEHEYRNPVDHYTDPDRYALEVERIIERTPLVVGHVGEFTTPGAYKTVQIGNVPVLVVGAGDGTIRAFVNVCRHRGTKLVTEPSGARRAFPCPYHAWTYGMDGALTHIPEEFGFPEVTANVSEYGLAELFCEAHQGFVYVRADGKAPSAPLGEWLSEVGRDLADLGLGDYLVRAGSAVDHPVNWKLPLDIFLENYHTKYTHRRTIYPVFLPNVAKFDRFGPHARCVLPRRTITGLREQDESTWDLVAESTLLYTIWPNTMVAVLPEHAAVWHVYPTGVDSCRLEFYALVSPRIAAPDEEEELNKSLAAVAKVKKEDAARFLGIQEGLKSGANSHLTFGRFEKALAWYHQSIDAALGDEAIPFTSAAR
jgi:phenylpropionate dioxygenase-like ring-hydroxylating dioxygenase large terminal subunit